MTAWAAIAIGGAAVLGAASQQKAAGEQAESAKNAAQAQVKANRENIEFQRDVFEQQREDQAPWREAGERALAELEQGVQEGRYTPGTFDFEFSQEDFEQSPGYQFRLKEGINALDRSAAARGRLQSGAQQKAVTEFASNLASQEYGNAFNRAFQEQQAEYRSDFDVRNQRGNRMASLAQIGQTANAQTQTARANMASQVGRSTRATGNAIAQGQRQAGNARASGYQGTARALNQGIQNYMTYDMINSGNAGGYSSGGNYSRAKGYRYNTGGRRA